MLNYDPDGVPDIDPDALLEAAEFGMRPIHVICEDEGAKDGDLNGVSFVVYVHFVPRPGESIQIEDGTHFRVKNIQYRVSNHNGYKGLVANVYAVKSAEG